MRIKSKDQKEFYGDNNEYKLSDKGLFKQKQLKDGSKTWNRISQYIKVSSIKQEMESKNVTLKLRYYYHNEYHEIDIRRDMLQQNELTKLSGRGVDISPSNVREVIDFLRLQELKAPKETVHRHMGWVMEEPMYYKLNNLIGKSLFSTYLGDYSLAPKGNYKDWRNIVETEVLGHSPLELALVFGFSAPIVSLLSKIYDMDTLLIHIFGNSTQGKTTAAQVAVSAFGRPAKNKKGLIKSWGATQNAIVAFLRDNYGVPIVLDEASMSQMKDFTGLIYTFAENREKERMNKDGELRKQNTWNTTIISTAEHSLFEKTNTNVGLRMRAFEFGNVIWTKSAKNAESLKEGLLENYGHAGEKFVQYLIDLGLETIVQRWEDWKNYCLENLPNTQYLGRVSAKFAILLLTAELIKEVFKLQLDMDNIIKLMVQAEEEAAEERDLEEKAYQYLIQRVLQHRNMFKEDGKKFNGYDCWGKIKFNTQAEVAIFQHKFKELLKEGSFSDHKVVTKGWISRKWLSPEQGKHTNRRVVFNGDEQGLRENSGLGTKRAAKNGDVVYVVLIDKDYFSDEVNHDSETIGGVRKAKRRKSLETINSLENELDNFSELDEFN